MKTTKTQLLQSWRTGDTTVVSETVKRTSQLTGIDLEFSWRSRRRRSCQCAAQIHRRLGVTAVGGRRTRSPPDRLG
jgi:hypothetical protein